MCRPAAAATADAAYCWKPEMLAACHINGIHRILDLSQEKTQDRIGEFRVGLENSVWSWRSQFGVGDLKIGLEKSW